MRFRGFLIFLFLVAAAIPVNAFSDDALFPLSGDLVITSSFGEFRLSHPHGGIDLRAPEGTIVVAPKDGYVWRIKTSCYGNGKSLYIKGDDGKIYMFMHLAGFVQKIFDRVFSEQLKTLRYSQDVFLEPSEIPVKRGELVGYTGKSGTDIAHLHYEVRDGNNCPTNPLLKHKINDTTPPTITRVALVPLGVNSTADGWVGPSVKAPKGKAVEFTASDKVGIAAEIEDSIPPSDRWLAPYRASLKSGETVLFNVEMDGFCYENRSIEFLVYHYGLLEDGHFLRLYSPEFLANASVSFWKNLGGVINVDGDKELSLEACDAGGNCSSVKIKISLDSHAVKKCEKPSEVFLSSDFVARCAGDGIERIGCGEKGTIKTDDQEISYGCPAVGESIVLDPWSLEVDNDALYGKQIIALGRVVRGIDLLKLDLVKISDAVKVLPSELLSERGLKLCITSNAPFPKDAGIYRIGRDDKSWLEGAEFSGDMKKLCAHVLRSGTFAVFEDNIAPKIGDARIVKGGWPQMWFVEFSLSDVGSGINPDKISATFDGTPLVVEFMPYEGRARAYLHFVPSAGPEAGVHEISITAQDNADNASSSVQKTSFNPR